MRPSSSDATIKPFYPQRTSLGVERLNGKAGPSSFLPLAVPYACNAHRPLDGNAAHAAVAPCRLLLVRLRAGPTTGGCTYWLATAGCLANGAPPLMKWCLPASRRNQHCVCLSLSHATWHRRAASGLQAAVQSRAGLQSVQAESTSFHCRVPCACRCRRHA